MSRFIVIITGLAIVAAATALAVDPPGWVSGYAPLPPLVSKVGGDFQVNPEFKKNAATLIDMADLSYAQAVSTRTLRPDAPPALKKLFQDEKTKFATEKLKLEREGWKLTPLNGKSGFPIGGDLKQDARLDKTVSTIFAGNAQFDEPQNVKGRSKGVGLRNDTAGFVATHQGTGQLVVVFHGSQDKHDWKDNLNSKMVPAADMGIGEGIDGRVHQGYASRYKSVQSQIDQIATDFAAGLDATTRPKLNITVTGHSLGGAMATMGFADISTRLAKKLFGKDYQNAKGNRIKAAAFSPSRALSEEAVTSLNKKGAGVMQNLIVDATVFDPVRKFGPGKSVTKWLKEATRLGPTKLVMVGLKKLGISETASPQKFAESHGVAKLAGTKALVSSGLAADVAKPLHQPPQKQGLVSKAISGAVRPLAPIHLGTEQGEKSFVFSSDLTKNLQNRLSLSTRINKNKPSSSSLNIPEIPANGPKLAQARLKPAAKLAPEVAPAPTQPLPKVAPLKAPPPKVTSAPKLTAPQQEFVKQQKKNANAKKPGAPSTAAIHLDNVQGKIKSVGQKAATATINAASAARTKALNAKTAIKNATAAAKTSISTSLGKVGAKITAVKQKFKPSSHNVPKVKLPIKRK